MSLILAAIDIDLFSFALARSSYFNYTSLNFSFEILLEIFLFLF